MRRTHSRAQRFGGHTKHTFYCSCGRQVVGNGGKQHFKLEGHRRVTWAAWREQQDGEGCADGIGVPDAPSLGTASPQERSPVLLAATLLVRAADRLAASVAHRIEAGHLSARSESGDALLDYDSLVDMRAILGIEPREGRIGA